MDADIDIFCMDKEVLLMLSCIIDLSCPLTELMPSNRVLAAGDISRDRTQKPYQPPANQRTLQNMFDITDIITPDCAGVC